jgi:hypothetical protein
MPEHGGRVVTVPLNTPNVHCLALALDEDGRCVGWAEVPQQDAKANVVFALKQVLMARDGKGFLDELREKLEEELSGA